MEQYIVPVALLVVLFVGFGLAHRNAQSGVGCSGCTSCADKSECKKKTAEVDAAKPQ